MNEKKIITCKECGKSTWKHPTYLRTCFKCLTKIRKNYRKNSQWNKIDAMMKRGQINKYYGTIISLASIAILLTLSIHATLTYNKVRSELFTICEPVCNRISARISEVNFWGEDSLCVCQFNTSFGNNAIYYLNGTNYYSQGWNFTYQEYELNK